jgi:hypothetical protein
VAESFGAPHAWLQELDRQTRVQAESLIDRLARAEAADPEEWAYSEITENIPQLARFLVLRRLWGDLIDPWRDNAAWIENMIASAEKDPGDYFSDAGLALRRLLEKGVDPADIASIARYVAYETAFGVVHTIDEGHDPEHSGDGWPGWTLIETDANGDSTGRPVGGLHEDLLSLDPSGREGRPG